MKKLITIILLLLSSMISYCKEGTQGEQGKKLSNEDMEKLYKYIEHTLKEKGKKEENKVPIATKTVMMGMHTNVVIPLEIISDIDIDAMVVDNQDAVIPFEIEVSKTPKKKDYYRIKYSEDAIDIDKDGKIDTHIYSSKYINSKIEKNNFVHIKGRNISKEGRHEKIIYIDVETKD
ncbi:hypothetical protein [Cetobacterium sp. SF1]|uniref:hypothetical protein n=1 Tax=Cetobacterium sp. SF1 TaxID=3417654 RepID=UPI003CEC9A60